MKTQLFITGSLVSILVLATAIAVTKLILPELNTSQVTSFSVNPQPLVISVTQKTDMDKAIPERVYPCLSSSAKQVVLLATAKIDKVTYYLMRSFEPSPYGHEHWTRAIVSTDSVGCLRLNPSEDFPRVSMSEFVPYQVAKHFALQLWQRELKKFGSKEKLRQELLDHLPPGPDAYVLFSEDIWALEQLGISIPKQLSNTSP